jgi:eukaryotic-like serine/threonine-protein kinase
MDNSLIGKSIDRYNIIEQLGQGGMATVYKAFDTRLMTDVAVKVIRVDEFSPDVMDRMLKRFEREARTTAKLTHPNIIGVIDYGEYEGSPYLVMPYIPGGTLKQRIKQGVMPWQDAVRMLIPVARALDFAHQQGVIHRDIKPSNILLTQAGEPMLSDFGVAKMFDVEETAELTGTGMGVGTPEYMAPEQTGRNVDHRVDIYALGIVLYEMVTGRRPYEAETPLEVLVKQASEPLPRPSKFAPGLPDTVEKILLKALAKKPEDRYQSMGEMAKALDGTITGGKQVAGKKKKDSKPPIQGKRTNWKLIGGVVLALLVLVIIAVAWQREGMAAQLFPSPTPTLTNTPAMALTPSATSAPLATNKPMPTNTLAATSTPVLDIGSTFIRDTDGMKMVYVPAGDFKMGASEGIGASDEFPQRTVYLDGYWIDQTEVTNKMYAVFLNAKGNEYEGSVTWLDELASNIRKNGDTWQPASGYSDYPVIYVSWFGAKAYCNWAGGRLPTEAEWEKAARGTNGNIYPWGNSDPSSVLLNYDKNIGATAKVGSYLDGASPYGALDIAGNAMEWVNDFYGEKYYQTSPASNPQGPDSGGSHVARGGAWDNGAFNVRSVDRSSYAPSFRSNKVGFRCVRDLNP